MRIISEEIENEYRELLKVNGYTDPDLESMNIDQLKATLKMQKKLNSEKKKAENEKANSTSVQDTQSKSKIKGIDMSRENAQLFANDIERALFQNDQTLNEEVIANERLRWNVGKATVSTGKDVMVLRNKEGECI